MLDEIGLDGRDRHGFRTFPDGSNLTIQVAARTGGSVDISKLIEIEIAQWAEVDLRVPPRLVDNAAWGEMVTQDEFMLQPGFINAITEFWNNVFAIGTVGAVPAVLLTSKDLRNIPDRVAGLQHRLERQPDVLGRPALVRPRIVFCDLRGPARSGRPRRSLPTTGSP